MMQYLIFLTFKIKPYIVGLKLLLAAPDSVKVLGQSKRDLGCQMALNLNFSLRFAITWKLYKFATHGMASLGKNCLCCF
jgi:hypothetical protein